MTFQSYKDRKVTIKSTGAQGTIEEIKHRRNSDGAMGARMMVRDEGGNLHELMPHEFTYNPINTDKDGAPLMGVSF